MLRHHENVLLAHISVYRHFHSKIGLRRRIIDEGVIQTPQFPTSWVLKMKRTRLTVCAVGAAADTLSVPDLRLDHRDSKKVSLLYRLHMQLTKTPLCRRPPTNSKKSKWDILGLLSSLYDVDSLFRGSRIVLDCQARRKNY